MKFVLFDIDGTLIDSGGAGTRSLNSAFKDLFLIEHAFHGTQLAGKTDIQIMNQALGKFGLLNGSETISALAGAYLKHLRGEINNGRKHIKPGIVSVLDILSNRDDCVLGLLTGNIVEGAMIKLDSLGLTKYFRWGNASTNPNEKGVCDPGAFGNDNEDRAKLLPIALRRFNEHTGLALSYADCIVIGDTPLDVRAAKPYGAVTVAVATGPYSTEQLRNTEADIVLADLSNPNPLVGLL